MKSKKTEENIEENELRQRKTADKSAEKEAQSGENEEERPKTGKIKKSEDSKVKEAKKMKAKAIKEERRVKKQERLKEKNYKSSLRCRAEKVLWNEVLPFCREHYLLAIIGAISCVFLIALHNAVDFMEDRHPSKHPNITDHVTFEIKSTGGLKGKLVFGLYGKDCPLTVKNFIMLATHEKGYGYVGSELFFVNRGHMIVGGDIVNNNGTSGMSALNQPFERENVKLRHKITGTLGMVALRDNDDSKFTSQFYISLGDLSHFNGHMVVFGHLLEDLNFLWVLERTRTDETMRPLYKTTIASAKHKQIMTQ